MKNRQAGMLLTYFGVGVVVDLLISAYTRMIALWLRPQASISGAVITLVTFVIFRYVIKKWNWFGVVAYSMGTGVGTWIGMTLLK